MTNYPNISSLNPSPAQGCLGRSQAHVLSGCLPSNFDNWKASFSKHLLILLIFEPQRFSLFPFFKWIKIKVFFSENYKNNPRI